MSFYVDLDRVRINTRIAKTREQAKECVQALMTNSNNRKRLIGLDVLHGFSRGEGGPNAILQLCDADQCFIFHISPNDSMPVHLRNFLNLPGFTFAGFGIQDALARLEKEYLSVCKNFLEVRPSVWCNSTPYIANEMLSMHIPSVDTISGYYDFRTDLTDGMIKLVVSNAVAAFRIADRLLSY